MPMTFSEILLQAESVRLDKREGLDPKQFDPFIEVKLADGQVFYITTDGFGKICVGNGSAA
jgi:hypothetical protein